MSWQAPNEVTRKQSQIYINKHLQHWVRPCEKTGPKNQWFKPVISENKSLARKKFNHWFKKINQWFLGLSQNFMKNHPLFSF